MSFEQKSVFRTKVSLSNKSQSFEQKSCRSCQMCINYSTYTVFISLEDCQTKNVKTLLQKNWKSNFLPFFGRRSSLIKNASFSIPLKWMLCIRLYHTSYNFCKNLTNKLWQFFQIKSRFLTFTIWIIFPHLCSPVASKHND